MRKKDNILERLKGGDLRSIGSADKIVMEILKKPSLCKEVFKGMTHVDALVRMRSADVLEKVGRIQPKYLQPYKHGLMGEVAAVEQQEVRWHVAQMFSYLDLDKSERATAAKTLFSWIESSSDKSKIVKV